ncbi:MAG: hypothetical protein AD742_19510 [Methylibium sp. NZG]|nr:MAG: hypothetical protein AD742_19510 [Methylibium sp. NZG]
MRAPVYPTTSEPHLTTAPPASVPSPCVSVCHMDAHSGWCEGCLRTIDEIAEWSVLDDRAKRAVWKLLPQRRLQFELSRRVLGAGEPGAEGG